MQILPNDPMLCLSVVNTRLRDHYANLEDLCEDLAVDKDALITKLGTIDYVYDESINQFV
ncbi:MAG: DUF4250 domain-containing protein [Tyzzerella sp.]|nr:DUF4250 domain-containing protein [Tyzzerella sp.]